MAVPADPTDIAWLSAQFGRSVARVEIDDMSDAGGLSGSMRRIRRVVFTNIILKKLNKITLI